jgi:type IV pilus assembly protein PilA
MIHQLRNQLQQEEGFTLIVLLVVILIIGILAAIAIPSFLNQRYKGQDACAKSMVKQMQTAAKTYQTDNNTYANLGLTSLTAIESSITGSTSQGNCAPAAQPVGTTTTTTPGGICNTTAPSDSISFCVSAVSLSGNIFAIAESGGGPRRGCTIAANGNAGGCKGTAGTGAVGGSW